MDDLAKVLWFIVLIVAALVVISGMASVGVDVASNAGLCSDQLGLDVRDPNVPSCTGKAVRTICGANGADGGWCDQVLGQ
jgi:hypothetical protein